MSIKYVILGYLSWQPMTGYDVKKIIAESEVLPWSANNNQIYRALVSLHEEGWVTKTVEEQDGSPNRHVYAITEAGLAGLKAWVMRAPEPPVTKHSFLNQMMWSDCLDVAEMDGLLATYLNEVGEKLFFMRVEADKKVNMPERTARESFLWGMIYQNWIAHFELELRWVREMREQLAELVVVEKRAAARRQREGV